MRRTLFWSGLLWLSFSAVLVAGQSATGVKPNRPEKLLGSWKQLPPDQPSTLKIEVEAGGIKMSEGCKEDGFCTSSIVGKYDGKLSKYPDDARWEASFRKMGDGTAQQDTYFHGKLDNTDISNNVGSVKYFLNAPLCSLRRVVFVVLLDLCIDDHGPLVIFRSASVRPRHLFDPYFDHDYFFELPFRGSGMPHQVHGVLLHAMSGSELSRVRTEL